MIEGILPAILARVSQPTAELHHLRDQPVRRRLLDLIKERPGLHASELAREVEEPWGTVQYHLSLLREAELVGTVDTGRELRFHLPEVDPFAARMLSLLHQGRRAEVLSFIQTHPGMRQVDICQALGVSRKMFRSCVRPLVDGGVVEERRGLHSNHYFVRDSVVEELGPLDALVPHAPPET